MGVGRSSRSAGGYSGCMIKLVGDGWRGKLRGAGSQGFRDKNARKMVEEEEEDEEETRG